MQYVISLFSTGGRVNPLAIALLIASLLGAGYAYSKFTQITRELELARQSSVVLDASKDKTRVINDARKEQREANKVIADGEFDNDFLKRLQRDD